VDRFGDTLIGYSANLTWKGKRRKPIVDTAPGRA
jgi:hypothetical protein